MIVWFCDGFDLASISVDGETLFCPDVLKPKVSFLGQIIEGSSPCIRFRVCLAIVSELTLLMASGTSCWQL